MTNCAPLVRRTSSNPEIWFEKFGLFGLSSTAIFAAVGTSVRSSSICLVSSSDVNSAAPVTLPPGRPRLATSPFLTGSSGPVNTIGIVEVAAFAARTGGVGTTCDNHRDLSLNQIGGHCRQSLVLAFRPSIFDRHIAALEITRFA